MGRRTRGRARIMAVALGAMVSTGCGDEEIAPAPAACYDDSITSDDLCTLMPDVCPSVSGELPAISEAITVVPDAEAMPEGVVSQNAHNNLDIVWHHGRLYFAFRTAPTHFADSEVVLYVVSTTDQKTWTLETSITLGKDLREPRFLTLGDELFLYFARLGEITFTFKPEAMMMTQRRGACDWTNPEEIVPVEGKPGSFICWRAREVDGVGRLIGYLGGDDIYDVSGHGTEVHWLQTEDGRSFHPVVPGASKVLGGGSSETDWAYHASGDLIAVSRNEAGEIVDGDAKFGSKICRATPDDLGDWQCVYDDKKYDSPLVFAHEGEIYLVGRRQVINDGDFDLEEDDLSFEDQLLEYQTTYWGSPKRCSLWKVNADNLTVDHMMDLPSNGDTCFASVIPLNDKQYLLYNYTSPLDDPQLGWRDGQFGPTHIYRLTLTMP